MDVPVFRAVNSQMDGEPEANLYMEGGTNVLGLEMGESGRRQETVARLEAVNFSC